MKDGMVVEDHLQFPHVIHSFSWNLFLNFVFHVLSNERTIYYRSAAAVHLEFLHIQSALIFSFVFS